MNAPLVKAETPLEQAIRMRDASAPGTMSFALWNGVVKGLTADIPPVHLCTQKARRIDMTEFRSPDAQRIVDHYLSDCGPEDLKDPVGWLIAAHDEVVRQLDEARAHERKHPGCGNSWGGD